MLDGKCCFFLLACVLAIFAATQVTSATDEETVEAKGGYYEIEGIWYYIDLSDSIPNRGRAKNACNNRNMSLIRFETREKWDTITTWIVEIPGNFVRRYYTDGIKYESSDEYIWETTGEKITEFYWGWRCPNFEPIEPSISSWVLTFDVWIGGYEDYVDPPPFNQYNSLFCQEK